MKAKLILLKMLLVLIIGSSCTHAYYVPAEGQLLGLQEKGDFKFSGALLSDEEADGFTGQLGYSPLNHVAIAGTAMHLTAGDRDASNNGKGYLYEGAIGLYYFLPLEESPKSQSHRPGVLFDSYAGIGRGNVFNKYRENFSSSFDFQYFYLQGAAHFQLEWVTFSFASKFLTLDYTTGVISGSNTGNADPNTKPFSDHALLQNDPFRELELSMRIAVGDRNISGYIGFTRMYDLHDKEVPAFTSPFQIGCILGIDDLYQLATKGKKKKK